MKGLFQCPPRAAPWVYVAISKAPCRGKSFINHLVLKLLPLQDDEFGDRQNPRRVGQTGQKFRVILCPTDFTDLHRYNEKKGLYATMNGWRIDPFFVVSGIPMDGTMRSDGALHG